MTNLIANFDGLVNVRVRYVAKHWGERSLWMEYDEQKREAQSDVEAVVDVEYDHAKKRDKPCKLYTYIYGVNI